MDIAGPLSDTHPSLKKIKIKNATPKPNQTEKSLPGSYSFPQMCQHPAFPSHRGLWFSRQWMQWVGLPSLCYTPG